MITTMPCSPSEFKLKLACKLQLSRPEQQVNTVTGSPQHQESALP